MAPGSRSPGATELNVILYGSRSLGIAVILPVAKVRVPVVVGKWPGVDDGSWTGRAAAKLVIFDSSIELARSSVNGELAQCVYLASHGSTWLAGGATGLPSPDLGQESWAFQFVGSVEFQLTVASGREYRASTAAAWLGQLRDRRVARIWLVIPDARPTTVGGISVGEHQLAGFANAGRWSLLAAGRQQPEIWRASWTVHDRQAADRRIWAVRYEGSSVDRVMPQRPELHAAATQLSWALVAARDFAVRQDLGGWAEQFERCLGLTEDDSADQARLLPPSYAPAAHRLLATADQAWVFGGMGSWNDLGFADAAVEQEYQQISRDLYGAVLAAILASTNCDFGTDAYR